MTANKPETALGLHIQFVAPCDFNQSCNTVIFIFLPSDLNVLDWGKNNILAIGLGSSVFLWNAKDGAVHHLADISSENDYVSSVSWAGNGKYLAVGSSDSAIQVRLHRTYTCTLCGLVCVQYTCTRIRSSMPCSLYKWSKFRHMKC